MLDRVIDRESFLEFVRALAEERAEAEQLEQNEPTRFKLGGAHDWQNGNISTFLYASLEYFTPKPFHKPEASPSWRMLAEMLYYGKIYE